MPPPLRRDKQQKAKGPLGNLVFSLFDEVELLKVVKEIHAISIYNWLALHPQVDSLDEIPFNQWSVSREAKKTLHENFVLYTSKVVETFVSNRGDTTKLLVELHDGHRVETVLMQHDKRSTVCVSSQVGCQMGCRFCATGTMGIIGDLTSSEILEQFMYAQKLSKLRNVVFMGMGEPLNNYENVKRAVQCMIDPKRFGLSPRHVSVSTVGVVKNMYRLTEELPQVNLALSLHAPNQETRLRIVPTASAHKIDKLLDAVDNHIQRNLYGPGNPTQAFSYPSMGGQKEDMMNEKEVKDQKAKGQEEKDDREDEDNDNDKEDDHEQDKNGHKSGNGKLRRALEKWTGVMIEYILIDEINSLDIHAHQLGAMLSANADRREHILLNLIPYNPTEVAEDFHPPSGETIERFAAICMGEPYRIKTKVRREMGQDIAGACGQLALVMPSKGQEHDHGKKDKAITGNDASVGMVVRDVEDVVSSSSSSASSSSWNGDGKTSKRPVAISTRSQMNHGNNNQESTISTSTTTTTTIGSSSNCTTNSNSSSIGSKSNEGNNNHHQEQDVHEEIDQDDAHAASSSSSSTSRHYKLAGIGPGVHTDGKWSLAAGVALTAIGVTALIGVVLLSRKATLR